MPIYDAIPCVRNHVSFRHLQSPFRILLGEGGGRPPILPTHGAMMLTAIQTQNGTEQNMQGLENVTAGCPPPVSVLIGNTVAMKALTLAL